MVMMPHQMETINKEIKKLKGNSGIEKYNNISLEAQQQT